jgi:predicted signal transduction protein with EAL and GGDEF domain
MWVGSQVDYATGSVFIGILAAFLGMVCTLFITVAFARRVDHAWMLVRRAAGYEQKRGALERIFVITAGIAVVGFTFWFLIIAGPGPELAPKS